MDNRASNHSVDTNKIYCQGVSGAQLCKDSWSRGANIFVKLLKFEDFQKLGSRLGVNQRKFKIKGMDVVDVT